MRCPPMSRSVARCTLPVRHVPRNPQIFIRHYVRRKHTLLNEHGPVNVQQVRFRRAPFRERFTMRRAFGFTARFLFWLYVFNKLGQYLGDRFELEEVDKQHKRRRAKSDGGNIEQGGKEEDTQDQDEEEEDFEPPEKMPEDAIFIPLWWGKQRPQEYYKGSDPEWQGYQKFSRDKQKRRLVEHDIVQRVAQATSGNKKLAADIGLPIKILRVWLDVDYPRGPPLEYDRPGIEIGDNYIALMSRPQSELQRRRVESALQPKSIALSLYASIHMYTWIQITRVQNFFNIKSNEQTSNDQPGAQPRMMIPDLPKISDKDGRHLDANLPPNPNNNNNKKEQTNSNSGGASATENFTTDSTATTKQTPTDTNHPPSNTATNNQAPPTRKPLFTVRDSLEYLTSSTPVTDVKYALAAFKHTLVATWRSPTTIDRGAVIFKGRVELQGVNARYIIDVDAAYHPGKNELTVVKLALKDKIALRASPRPG